MCQVQAGAYVSLLTPGETKSLYDTAVWYLVWVCGRVGVFGGGMNDAIG